MPLFLKFKFWEETKLQRKRIFLLHDSPEKGIEEQGTPNTPVMKSSLSFSLWYIVGLPFPLSFLQNILEFPVISRNQEGQLFLQVSNQAPYFKENRNQKLKPIHHEDDLEMTHGALPMDRIEMKSL